MTMGLGIFMMLAGVFVFAVLGQYTISILMGAVFILAGILGVVGGSRIKPRATPAFSTNPNPVVEVRCKSCNALNPESGQYCSRCGSPL